jgi:hypothetical protein
MSDPQSSSRLNGQIEDAVESVARTAVGNSPDPLALAVEQTTALAMFNAVQAQQSDHLIADAAIARVVANLLRNSPQNSGSQS